jgi:hypothetical protein
VTIILNEKISVKKGSKTETYGVLTSFVVPNKNGSVGKGESRWKKMTIKGSIHYKVDLDSLQRE